MMFNGLLMCTDSDSDFKESLGASSEADTPETAGSSSATGRAEFYHTKLLATLQVLQNKEETIRVQAESLSVAEARIASLSARAAELRRQIERKDLELQDLRNKVEDYRIEKSDASITAHIQEIDNQKNIVKTLQNNIDVIEELYRECFYETAKQEDLIEMLRKSCLDVRLMEKDKVDQVSRLHYVINTQKWSLDKCQDIAADVENLKVEISNFLNSSNNDSGVWEETAAVGLADDWQDITTQLLKLRELLTGDCTCGLQEENARLKQNNEAMITQMNNLQQKIVDLEAILENKDAADKIHQELIKAKESELQVIREQLAAAECDRRERGATCDALREQLQRSEALLRDRSAELARAEARDRRREEALRALAEELDHKDLLSKEACERGGRCPRSLGALPRTVQRAARSDTTTRNEVKQLERALLEAHARGAALCAEGARACAGVRACTRRHRDLAREQEELIKRKNSQIRMLERALREQNVDPTRGKEIDTCSKCVQVRLVKGSETFKSCRNASANEPTCSKYLTHNDDETTLSFTSGSSNVRQRRECRFDTSASETDCSPAPEKPSRIRKFICEHKFGGRTSTSRDAQRPERRDAASGAARCRCRAPVATFEGSLEEVCARVDSAVAARARAQRRWQRRARETHD